MLAFEPNLISLVALLILLGAVLYTIHSLLNKGLIKIRLSELFVYCGTLALIGPFGEVVINTFCRTVFGHSLWQYQVFPVHGGDTSLYSFFIWSIYYGFHLYLLHTKIDPTLTRKSNTFWGIVMALDALALEALLNVASLLVFNTYIFFYFPPDLFHLTTILVMPFYFIAGFAVVKTLRRFLKEPIFFGLMAFIISFTFLYI
ncbi:MAG: hypothetical protein KBC50_01320 [Candidatus Pacebacteria bacterium]|nr:hypothetical protein [Candidatus Paceibacterota bacterium]